MSMLVRLKPYNKRRGHLLRRVNFRGVKFEAHKGWYKVDDNTAAQLGNVRQTAYDEDSPQAFDVLTQDEARAVEASENKAKQEKAKAADPIDAAIDRTADMKSDDLSGPAPSSSRRTRRSKEPKS